jgi:hypothetical protein
MHGREPSGLISMSIGYFSFDRAWRLHGGRRDAAVW